MNFLHPRVDRILRRRSRRSRRRFRIRSKIPVTVIVAVFGGVANTRRWRSADRVRMRLYTNRKSRTRQIARRATWARRGHQIGVHATLLIHRRMFVGYHRGRLRLRRHSQIVGGHIVNVSGPGYVVRLMLMNGLKRVHRLG